MYFNWIESPLEKCSREKAISSISLRILELIKVMDFSYEFERKIQPEVDRKLAIRPEVWPEPLTDTEIGWDMICVRITRK